MARRGAANARRSPGAGRALSQKGREIMTTREGGRVDDQEEHKEKDEQDEEEQHDGHDHGDDW